MYKCTCGAIHSAEEWNRATVKHYNCLASDISLIEWDERDSDFACPTCGEIMEFHNIERV